MKISKEEVERAANLARLAIAEKEKDRFAEQLTHILEHIAKLNELNTDDIEPTSHVLPLYNIFKEDRIHKIFPDKSPLENAPQAEHKHYKVPKIIE